MIPALARAQSGGAATLEELMAAPEQGGARRWQVAEAQSVTLRKAPGGAALPGPALELGAVVTNFGCAAGGDGQMWCQVQTLMGGARGFAALADLAPVAGPDGVLARGRDDSTARAKRKRFDAAAEVPCAQEHGEALAPCPIGVARGVGGDVTAAVTFKAGFTRLLFFRHGRFISASATMSGAGRDTDWARRAGVHHIRVDDQRFEIPDALLFGS